MKSDASGNSELCVPPDDGAISRALDDLDSKLSAWRTAVTDVHKGVATPPGPVTPADGPDPAPSEADDAAAPPEQPESPVADASGGAVEIDEPLAPPDPVADAPADAPPDEPAVDNSSSTDAPLGVMGPESVETIRLRQVLSVAGKRASDGIDEESEALLRTLDPEVARAIRVQHRLFDGRRNVQELIDEYKHEPQEKKKNWWQRNQK